MTQMTRMPGLVRVIRAITQSGVACFVKKVRVIYSASLVKKIVYKNNSSRKQTPVRRGMFSRCLMLDTKSSVGVLISEKSYFFCLAKKLSTLPGGRQVRVKSQLLLLPDISEIIPLVSLDL